MAKGSHPPAIFNPETEAWDDYMGRYESYLVANEYQDYNFARKRAVFETHCGNTVYKAVGAIVESSDVDMTWDILKEKLQRIYAPPPTRVVSRYEFFRTYQKEKETLFDFETALRCRAKHCQFGGFLEDALLSQFIQGIRDSKLQEKLLVEDDSLTFKSALVMARAAETSARSALAIRPKQGKSPPPKTVAKVTESPGLENQYSDDSDGGGEEVFRLDNKRAGGREMFCGCCGGINHVRNQCYFRDARCRCCGKIGHLAKACKAPRHPAKGNGRQYESRERDREESTRERKRDDRWDDRGRPGRSGSSRYTKQRSPPGVNSIGVHQVREGSCRPIVISATIEGSPCQMQIDTGSSITIMSWDTAKELMPGLTVGQLKPMTVRIADCQGRVIPVLGTKEVTITYEDQEAQLPLTIARDKMQSLLGRDWFGTLKMKITRGERVINALHMEGCEDLIREFQDVFNPGLGRYVGKPISFNLDQNVRPVRLRPRRVPFALKPRIDKEIDKLISQGILEQVDHAKWETPIVPIIKGDGSIRICADYKCTINKALQQSAYPVPVVQHLLHTLGPGAIFAKLDLAQAYQQLPVDRETAEAQTIVTHRGAFKCNRLQFGVSVAPGVFQGIMERVLSKLPGVVPYFDDVLISAEDVNQLRERLRAVLGRFRNAGLRVKADKCQIGVPEVEFLGYRINKHGLHPTHSKIKAIKEAPTPTNKTELQAFLGLLNFYCMFLKDKATIAEPLHKLLAKKNPWQWGPEQQEAFQGVKELLTEDKFLMQFQEELPVVLVCDASPFGVGAVLGHRLPDGREAPIAYFSRTLSSAERNYGQIDREALAAVAGVKRFHEYLCGREFELVTDHKPLLGLLAGSKPTPDAMPPRMLRWALFLAAYNFKLTYRAGKEMGNADALSRCPLPELVTDPAPGIPVLHLDLREPGLVTAADIAAETEKDQDLCTIMNWVKRGWPKGPFAPNLVPYSRRQHEIAVQGGCLLWGERVLAPLSLREEILRELHEGHPGIVRMKALARSFVWWPQLDKDIEEWVAGCTPCQESRAAPPKTTVWDWEQPKSPWSRIHIDFAGPFHGQMFLIVIDAYSKWIEVVLMKSTTAEMLIKGLQRIFSTHGYPDNLVSDNGPQLTAVEFEAYLASIGVKHTLIAPYKPSSNGLAERAVRATKEALSRLGPGDWQNRIDTFLLTQHITPIPNIGKSPAELLMGRKIRSKLDRLHPLYGGTKTEAREEIRAFENNTEVYARNYTQGQKWVPGQIIEVRGPKSYIVQLGDGRTWRRHIDQLRERKKPNIDWESVNNSPHIAPTGTPRLREGHLAEGAEATTIEPRGSSDDVLGNPTTSFQQVPEREPERNTSSPAQPTDQNELRRSTRVVTRPAYLDDYVC